MSKLTKKHSNYRVLGMMSGTSLDGVDMAYCEFNVDNRSWYYSIKNAETVAYDKPLNEKLANAIQFSSEQLMELDVELGKWFGKAARKFIDKNGIEIDFICSHGHTIFHQPERGFTTQIGNGFSISKEVNKPVVCDFRSKDVSLGGQGAPLVPIGDRLLFSSYDYCLNLGGISNISFEKNGIRKAFDIGPCNMLLNHLANQKGLLYDDNGDIASEGNLDDELFNALNSWEYYNKKGPKSLGYEQISESLIPRLKIKLPLEDKMATAAHHIAYQISRVTKTGNLLVTGGGAHNSFLINLIKKYASDVKVKVPEKELIDFKEALVFGLLGVLKVRGEVNCLASVTGASTDSCGGVIYQ